MKITLDLAKKELIKRGYRIKGNKCYFKTDYYYRKGYDILGCYLITRITDKENIKFDENLFD